VISAFAVGLLTKFPSADGHSSDDSLWRRRSLTLERNLEELQVKYEETCISEIAAYSMNILIQYSSRTSCSECLPELCGYVFELGVSLKENS
jgi:hypothetical protein